MFGIGGGELVFIMFIVLMLFGSDKVPEMARTMGKAMAQLKNATNDIKSEIQKGAEANGFDQNTLNSLTGGINSEISKAKNSILGDAPNAFNNIGDTFTSEINKTKDTVLSGTTNPDGTTLLDDITGPVKRQM
nr:twin-arginine translocase TatA/TatE family subunit [uncultured Flavobacterium sp.]